MRKESGQSLPEQQNCNNKLENVNVINCQSGEINKKDFSNMKIPKLDLSNINSINQLTKAPQPTLEAPIPNSKKLERNIIDAIKSENLQALPYNKNLS